ncbi:Ribosomal RNA adenine dimethylase domain-containing protein 1 [Halocaridina rubra]|uniref:Ribosomal RNA adenine dimethylase domain-containing protein 1 n=1 Tax=Halocaridina rubra TaxID=373956 RepID=A0AAN8WQK5_HALRR
MTHAVEINKDNIELWKSFIAKSLKLLDIYRSLLDTYVLDFFTEDLWSCIDPKWSGVFELLSPKQLAEFLSKDEILKTERVWPLSLLALRASAFTYALPRKPIVNDSLFLDYLNKCHQSSALRDTPRSDGDTGESNSKSDSTYLTSENAENCGFEMVDHVDHTVAVSDEIDAPSFGTQNAKNLHDMHPLHKVEVSWGDAVSELSPEGGQHKLLQHVFRRHLKPKKQHEIARLAYIAAKVAHIACNDILVDVGSGQGHLSRFLAYGHSVRIVCLEAQDEFIKGAKKFDHQLETAIEKMKRSAKYGVTFHLPLAPRHAVCHLDVDMDPLIFEEVVKNTWPELDSRVETCGLLGLHTCGNLAATLLRLFTHLPTCQAVISVGCCYMKLNENCNETTSPGYPMSEFVKALASNRLTYEAREVACHAIEMYTDRLKLGAENLKVHCYRAALEEIIIAHWPEHRHAGLRSVSHAHKMTFAEYAVAAVSRVENVKLNEDELTSEKTKTNLDRWMQVVVYYSLRLLLAPVVESVILLDRLLYLYEKDVEGVLLPVFDPLLSPRNHVLIAVKQRNTL